MSRHRMLPASPRMAAATVLVLGLSSAHAVPPAGQSPDPAKPIPVKGAPVQPAGSTATTAHVRTVVFSPNQEISIPVAKGVLTHIVLAEDDVIRLPPGLGQGSDCKQEFDAWCVAASGRDVFVKPRAGANGTNMAVITNRRRYTFDLQVQQAGNSSLAVRQLKIELPASTTPAAAPVPTTFAVPTPPPLTAQDLVANRMKVLPQVVNANYSVAVGAKSEELVPSMVFDDGAQTYFSFPHNLPLPTVFETAPDGSEQMVNVHMQDDQLVAERVSRRFLLRLGDSVVAVINEKFDSHGRPPLNGTSVPGVARVLKDGTQPSTE